LSLRPLEKKYDLLLYADDVIYFPKSSTADPIKDLSNKNLGLKVKESKSKWIKRDGIWIAEFIQFLGMRYYPPTYYNTWYEAVGLTVILWGLLDILLLGFPVFSLIWVIITLRGRWLRHRAKFRAATRDGASLEFTTKEAFLSYLNVYRTLLINYNPDSQLRGADLEITIQNVFHQFLTKMANPVLLWQDVLRRTPMPTYPHVPLVGWFTARMQSDSWYISHSQDFRLKWIKGSWLAKRWEDYKLENILSSQSLTIFTASSFACADLLDSQSKSRKLIRRIPISVENKPFRRPLSLERFLSVGFV
jgi:hypothetical protein